MTVRERRVHPVPRRHQLVVRDDVGGGEAEVSPAPISRHHRALEDERRPEAAHRRLHLPGGHQRADPSRGDGLAVDLDQRHHPGLELRAGGEHLGVPLGPGTEAEVLPHRHPAGAEAVEQDLLDEPVGGDGGELTVEGDHHQFRDPEPLDHIALHLEGHDQLRGCLRMDHRQRVRPEGEDGVGVVDHRAVAAVDAVEDADRDVAILRGGVGELGDLDAHWRTSPRSFRVLEGEADRREAVL
jgi:hypothetical protein